MEQQQQQAPRGRLVVIASVGGTSCPAARWAYRQLIVIIIVVVL